MPLEVERRRFNYSLMLPYVEPNIPAENRDFMIVVVVNSAANGIKHRHLRQSIRETWGGSTLSLAEQQKWALFFVLGQTENYFENQTNLQEAFEYNDLLIGNFTDHYYNIATKTFMGHFWALKRLNFKYILKTDDDVYVRIPQTINWLQSQNKPRHFYGGYIKNKYLKVSREKTSKWYLTRGEFAKDSWSPYCHGAFHIISSDIVGRLIKYTKSKTPYFADDAYIGDILLNEMRILPTQIPGFGFAKPGLNECELVSHIAIGHRIDDQLMVKYHRFYQALEANKEKARSIKWQCSFWFYRHYLSKLWEY